MSATYALACGHTVVVPHGGSAKCEPCDALAQYVGALVKRSEVTEATTTAPIGPDGFTPLVPEGVENARRAEQEQRFADPGAVDPPVDCRCGHRREWGVGHHQHIAGIIATAARERVRVVEGERDAAMAEALRDAAEFCEATIADALGSVRNDVDEWNSCPEDGLPCHECPDYCLAAYPETTS